MYSLYGEFEICVFDEKKKYQLTRSLLFEHMHTIAKIILKKPIRNYAHSRNTAINIAFMCIAGSSAML